MKTLIWLIAGLLAAVWTGMVALTVQVSDWLLNAVASAPAVGGAAAPLPVPAWLAHWLPGAGGLMEWITPLLWTGWALGLLPLLALAGFLHWLAGRTNPPAALRNAQA